MADRRFSQFQNITTVLDGDFFSGYRTGLDNTRYTFLNLQTSLTANGFLSNPGGNNILYGNDASGVFTSIIAGDNIHIDDGVISASGEGLGNVSTDGLGEPGIVPMYDTSSPFEIVNSPIRVIDGDITFEALVNFNGAGSFYPGTGSGGITILGPIGDADFFPLFLPLFQGDANSILTNDGEGSTSWTNLSNFGVIIQGGNNYGEDITIGDIGGHSLNFITDSQVRLILSSDGSINIPSLNPNQIVGTDGSDNLISIPFEEIGDINNGGNAFSAPIEIGTTDNFNLLFITDNITRLTIATTGLVTGTNNYVFPNTFGTVFTGTTGAITLTAPNSAFTSYALTLPALQGANNTVLTNNGSGNLFWSTTGGSGSIDQDGNSFGESVRIGAIDDFSLEFLTNDITRVTIDENGMVTLTNNLIIPEGFATYFSGISGYVAIQAPSVNIEDSYTLYLPEIGPSGSRDFIASDAEGILYFISEEEVGNIRDGGNAFSAPIDIGTKDNFGLSFITDSLVRFTVANDGVLSAFNHLVFPATFGSIFSGSSGTVTLRAPNSLIDTYILNLPDEQGTVNTVLSNDGSGNLFWSTTGGSGTIDQGGNSFTENVVIGSNDAYSLVFRTNSTNVVEIDIDGNMEVAGQIIQSGTRKKNAFVSTGSYTPTINVDNIFVDTTSSVVEVILPDASISAYNGQEYRIIDKGGNSSINNITITPTSCLIVGASSYIINTNYGGLIVISDGTNWSIV